MIATRTSIRPCGAGQVPGRAQVVELGAQPPVGLGLGRGEESGADLLRRPDRPPQEPVLGGRRLPQRRDLLEQEGPDGEQQPVAGAAGVDVEQRGVDQAVQQPHRVVAGRHLVGELLDGGQVDAAGERGDGPQQGLLRRRSAGRRTSGWSAAASAAGPPRARPRRWPGPEPPSRSRTAVERQHRDLAGDELDGERQAVEVLQDLDERRRVDGGQLEAPGPGAGRARGTPARSAAARARRGRRRRAGSAAAGGG